MVNQSTGKVAKTKQMSSGIGIAALVVGIVAFVTGWVIVWGLLAGATAVVLGLIALKKSKANKGFGIAGIVLGAIAVLTSLVFTVLWVVALTVVTTGTAALLRADQQVKSALDSQQTAVQKQIDAKKYFGKGDTATFGNYSVKVNSVTRNYTPTDTSMQASDGKEFVVVNVSVKNTASDSQSFTKYDLKMIDNGIANDASFSVDDSPDFTGGEITPGATTEGNIVFEVTTGATGLKLQYETTVYSTGSYQAKTLTYTLAI
jgi:hypothetical protein